MWPARAGAWLLGLGLAAATLAQSEPVPPGFDLVYSQDFVDANALDDLTFTDSRAWSQGREAGESFLELGGGSEYAPPFRSPLNIALLRDLAVDDFVIEVRAMQTGREYGHRDLCFFFGFEAVDRFYYVHLATTPDPNAHNVFRVDRAARSPTTEVPDQGVEWGSGTWHLIRIERHSGLIQVSFDSTRVLTSTDDVLGAGRIGVGSFDDSGRFTDLRVWAPTTAAPASLPFGVD